MTNAGADISRRLATGLSKNTLNFTKHPESRLIPFLDLFFLEVSAIAKYILIYDSQVSSGAAGNDRFLQAAFKAADLLRTTPFFFF